MKYRIVYSRNSAPQTQHVKTYDEAMKIAERLGMCGYTVDIYEELPRTNTRLKSAREQRGLSQSELAAKVGISERTMQGYEQGQKSLAAARADTVIKMAHVLKVKPEYLIKGGK